MKRNQKDNSPNFTLNNYNRTIGLSLVLTSEGSQEDLIDPTPGQNSKTKPFPTNQQVKKASLHFPNMQTNRKTPKEELPKARVFESQYTTIKRSPSPLAGKSFLKNGSVMEKSKFSPKMSSQISTMSKINTNLLMSTNQIMKKSVDLEISEVDQYSELLTARAHKLVSRTDSVPMPSNISKLINQSRNDANEFNGSQQNLKDQDLMIICLKSKTLFNRNHVSLANNSLTVDGLSVFLFYAAQNSIQAGSVDLRKNKISERAIDLISVFLAKYPNLISDIDLRENGIQGLGLNERLREIERTSGTSILI